MPPAKRPPKGNSKVPFLERVEIQPDRVESWTAYPFHLPFVRNLRLDFTTPLTFLIGENGSGKTTLIEAIADICRLPIGGGGRTELADDLKVERPRSLLAGALRPRFRERPWDGYFVRAENLVRLADLLDERSATQIFAVTLTSCTADAPSRAQRSHGEAFIALFEHRLQPGGILIMDEPEAALSPQRQLSLLAQLHAFLESGQTQVFIATHSPILMTFPGATLLEIREDEIVETRLEETSHYQVTRGILDHPERYWKYLRGGPVDPDDE
jgi:predicted ATPase